MKTRIYKETYFEASHRLLHYEGKCFRLHGHQWRVEVWVAGEIDEKTKIIVDYNCIKEVIQHFDHQVILNATDPMVECLSRFQEVITTPGDPTSELLADLMAQRVNSECTRRGIAASVEKIRVWESTSCYAECVYVDQ
jgi:6-pyruvoyltetrahydropterin/6-carboxytetrahydropterin synthase